ncbi:MAG: protein kinase domain-containing protein [Acidimicrobiia bacterium]
MPWPPPCAPGNGPRAAPSCVFRRSFGRSSCPEHGTRIAWEGYIRRPGLEKITDRFEIGDEIASGGMATVWRGRDRSLDRAVAIKRLHPNIAAEPQAADRFKREALAAASLSHPGVVTVFDAGEDQEGPFIVMEFVEGETLADLLRREGRLSPERAVEIAARVAEALDHAHRRGLVHRDVKPGNILLDPAGNVKVADFGIAKSLQDTDRFTKSGTVLGTVAYLAPEQAAGDGATAASDIYGLGVVLYELLTGRVPFEAETPVAVALAHQTQAPARPGRFAPVPSTLEEIIMRALAKDPGRRFGTAEEMAGALRGWQAGRAPAPVPPATGAEAARTAPMEAAPSRTRRQTAVVAAPPSRAAPLPWGVLALLGALLLVGLLIYLISRESPPQETVATTVPPPTTAAIVATTATPTTAPPSTTTTVQTVQGAYTDLLDLLDAGAEEGVLHRKAWNELRKKADESLEKFQEGDLEDAANKLREFDEKADEAFEKGEITSADFVRALHDQTELIRQLGRSYP